MRLVPLLALRSIRRTTLVVSSALVAALVAAPAQAQPKQRIADLWYAHNAVVLMLGSADRVVATVARPQAFPWMMQVAPAMRRAQPVANGNPNAEDLLAAHADVVFASRGAPSIAAMQRLGLDVVPVGFSDFDSMLACVDQTAAALDTPLAAQRARDYRAYLDDTLAATRRALDALPDSAQRSAPRVLHVASLAPLKVDGSDTIVDQWLRAAGARNAADGLVGNLRPVSIEQVLAWHPDVVILGANAGSIEQSPQRALWHTLDAVRDGRMYRNPAGVFPWDRYGPEVALQVRWAAGVLHPGVFPAQQLVGETQGFYRRFFGYALSAEDAQRMLAGLPPAGNASQPR
ncbi:ABC transporter substrate-binding protein [Burkholderia sp. Ac-20379]|uniref:ABC transporter substrate-binding protein n=1 Tax=Burkholderia sp. Ac-20379 TaxID=2703900 RepID=UPI00197D7A66|nr:ABC transporter substrate-binding protein [Burkholderia sp. Ac-20379]MBN3728571.1 ABC transporter substrate-binding protein [Burkholderia sp. Ac-20379]